MPLDGTDYEAPAISDADRQAADLLRRAKEVISDPAHWCQGASSRSTAYGVSYCMMGAVTEANGLQYPLDNAHMKLIRAADGPVTVWNDHPERTHAEVLAAFDRAIALCEGK